MFLIADSATTRLGRISPEITSVGEYRIFEDAPKLAKLSNSVAGAVIGNARRGLAALEIIRYRLLQSDSLEDAVTPVIEMEVPDFDLLLASQTESNANIWVVSPSMDVKQTYEDLKPVILGSLPQEVKQVIATNIVTLVKRDQLQETPEFILSAIMSILQAMSQRCRFTNHSVGGLFFGMYIDSHGVKYQKDIVYIIYKRASTECRTPLLPLPIVAWSAIRSGLLVAGSPITSTIKGLSNCALTKEQESQELLKLIDKNTWDFAALIDKDSGSVVHVCVPEDHLKIGVDGINLNPKLIDVISSLSCTSAQTAQIIFLCPEPKLVL